MRTQDLSLSFFFVGEVFINLIMNTIIFPQALTAVSPAHLQRARLECGRSRERILHLTFFFYGGGIHQLKTRILEIFLKSSLQSG